jgi:hypothetical protein
MLASSGIGLPAISIVRYTRGVNLADSERIEIPRLPVGRSRAELPPIIEPPLRDMPEFDGRPPDSGPERFEGEPLELPGEELAQRATELALADERVHRELEGGRYSVSGVSWLLDRKDDGPAAVVVIYSYARGVALEVSLVGEGDRLQVSDLAAVDSQPPPSDEEVELAIRLARDDRRISDFVQDDSQAMVLLTSVVERGDQDYGRRRVLVAFGPPEERLPRLRALVDLGEERVLAAATVLGDRLSQEAGE